MAALFLVCGKLNESEVVMLVQWLPCFLVCGNLNESEVVMLYSGCPVSSVW